MSNILQELEAEIKKATASVSQENVGVIRSVGDGVAKIEGLSGVMLNEMIEFPGGVMGLAMNLEEHEVGAVILGDDSNLKEGDLVKCSGRLLSVPVGRSLLGRVVNTLGEPIDGKGPIEAEAYYPVEKIASGIISRQSVTVPVQTGILPIDAMIPIGRGQRELIIGDRATGKTAIAMDTMIAQADQNRLAEEGKLPDHQPLYNIYVAIGQKRANISRLVAKLEETGAMKYSIVVAASASDPAAMLYPGPVCRLRDGRILHGQGGGRPHRLRRPLQTCRGLPPDFPDSAPPLRSRGVSGGRILPAQPPAGTRRAHQQGTRRRFPDGPPHH